jgi:hypothetical protein
VNEQKRSIIKQEFATKPLSASAELDLISPESVWSERQSHDFSE